MKTKSQLRAKKNAKIRARKKLYAQGMARSKTQPNEILDAKAKSSLKKKAKNQPKRMSTKTLVMGAILTALVIILQYMSIAFRSVFSITLSLFPIVIGAISCGTGMGAWLGFVFGTTVLLTGDAAPFWAVNPFGTFVTVIIKGVASGVVPALIYNLLKKKNTTLATTVAAILSPISNTGVFLLGCSIFFIPTLIEWYGNVTAFLITIFSFNFLIELVLNIALTPVIIRLLNIRKKI